MEEIKEMVLYYDAIMIDGELWFSAINSNGLYKMNITTKKLQLIAFFPKEDLEKQFLHSKILQYENKLFFVPFQAKEIAIYDMEKGTMSSLELPPNSQGKQYSKFYTAIQEQQYIYCVPCRYEYLVKYDICQKKMEFYDVFKGDKEHKWNDEDAFIYKGACKVNKKIYLASYVSDYILEYDLETRQSNYFDLPVQLGGISNLLNKDNIFWIIGRNGSICKWNGEHKEIEVIKGEEFVKLNQCFFDALIYDNNSNFAHKF